jgi:hypothetical protein
VLLVVSSVIVQGTKCLGWDDLHVVVAVSSLEETDVFVVDGEFAVGL